MLRSGSKPGVQRRVGVLLGLTLLAGRRLRRVWPLARSAALIVLLVVAVQSLVAQALIWRDDLRYGRPRTTQLSARLGLEAPTEQPTHVVGLNLNRRVVVIVFPGGDPARAQILVGPHLFGAREDLTPVRLRADDINRDGRGDLVVNIKNEEVIYINDGQTFRLITDQERQQILAHP